MNLHPVFGVRFKFADDSRYEWALVKGVLQAVVKKFVVKEGRGRVAQYIENAIQVEQYCHEKRTIARVVATVLALV